MLGLKRAAFMSLAMVALASCAPSASRSQVPNRTEVARCLEGGGSYQQVGMFGSWSCVVAYPDGGRSCTDGSQCAGACISEVDPLPQEGDAVQGACQRTSAQFGCFAAIETGRARHSVCVD
jgi:hypothetical protein